ncbi:MAG: sigma-54-dependent Fis family transcriptional regulator [Calditrichaeota bacterium]|nr:MAG: sigma-54-dependent Fis family transcriptional regulator [Calditrichota bacterium]
MQKKKNILVAARDSSIKTSIQMALEDQYAYDYAASLAQCTKTLESRKFDYLFLDFELWRMDADFQTGLSIFLQIQPMIEIIIMCSRGDAAETSKMLLEGAGAKLMLPATLPEIRQVMEQLSQTMRMQSEIEDGHERFWRSESLTILRTNSPQMKQVFGKVRSVSRSKSTVLLTGETGTGKGVIANLIHQHSNRREKQFISVHCGAIPDTLLESELFGHEKGAFTGAVRRRLGKFELADGGTLFLDEIGTISSAMQIKLLQVLQDHSFQRVGGEATLKTDVRIIAATNSNLKKMVEEGLFRRDLYYRLNVFPIEIPPLRERIADISLLIEYFINNLNRFYGKKIQGIEPEILPVLRSYSWPGNIRELENIIERAYIIENSSLLTPSSFPAELFGHLPVIELHSIDTSRSLAAVRAQEVARIEKKYLQEQLAKQNGKIFETASASGIGVRQLHKLMIKYQISKEMFKKRN